MRCLPNNFCTFPCPYGTSPSLQEWGNVFINLTLPLQGEGARRAGGVWLPSVSSVTKPSGSKIKIRSFIAESMCRNQRTVRIAAPNDAWPGGMNAVCTQERAPNARKRWLVVIGLIADLPAMLRIALQAGTLYIAKLVIEQIAGTHANTAAWLIGPNRFLNNGMN